MFGVELIAPNRESVGRRRTAGHCHETNDAGRSNASSRGLATRVALWSATSGVSTTSWASSASRSLSSCSTVYEMASRETKRYPGAKAAYDRASADWQASISQMRPNLRQRTEITGSRDRRNSVRSR
jgi:hypothetical protein